MKRRRLIFLFKRIKNALFKRKNKYSQPREKIIKNISRNGAKDCFTGDDSFSFQGKNHLIKKDINEQARYMIKQALESPEDLLDFIESKGTVIIRCPHMDKILKLFGEKEGFITPLCGIKAFLLTLIISKISPNKLQIGFKTPAMFALKDVPVNIYTISHQFHLWLSYINDLPGFEENNMKNFKAYWDVGPESNDVSCLSVEEILSLSDIIAREMEALDFVREIAREFMGQKSSLKKIREGKSVNL